MKKLGWKHSISEIMVALGRARRRDVSNTMLQQSLAELRRIRQSGAGSDSPSDLVDGKLVDGASPRPSAPQQPGSR